VPCANFPGGDTGSGQARKRSMGGCDGHEIPLPAGILPSYNRLQKSNLGLSREIYCRLSRPAGEPGVKLEISRGNSHYSFIAVCRLSGEAPAVEAGWKPKIRPQRQASQSIAVNI